jgi:endoglucanase
MKFMPRLFLPLFLFLCALPTSVVSLPGAEPDVFAQQRRLGRGLNMGNSLEGPTEGAWGHIIQDEDFPRIRAAGFASIRLPVKWSAHAATEAPYAIDPVFLKRVDHVVRTAMASGLAVVLNVHHYDELDKDPPAHRARLAALWAQIADHFADFPDDLQFEVSNEPNGNHTAELWNETFPPALKEIRRKNPTRAVHVGGVLWNQISSLPKLQLPADDRHLIAHIHYYAPFHFTHQGAFWIKGSKEWVGTKWDGTESDLKNLRRDFDAAAAWGKQENRPVFLGEFGACAGVPDMAARVRWTRAVVAEAEARGITWAYWEYQANFGIWDPKAREWRKELLGALVGK